MRFLVGFSDAVYTEFPTLFCRLFDPGRIDLGRGLCGGNSFGQEMALLGQSGVM